RSHEDPAVPESREHDRAIWAVLLARRRSPVGAGAHDHRQRHHHGDQREILDSPDSGAVRRTIAPGWVAIKGAVSRRSEPAPLAFARTRRQSRHGSGRTLVSTESDVVLKWCGSKS